MTQMRRCFGEDVNTSRRDGVFPGEYPCFLLLLVPSPHELGVSYSQLQHVIPTHSILLLPRTGCYLMHKMC